MKTLRQSQIPLIIALAIALFLISRPPVFSEEEKVGFTTYFPAPVGAYRNLDVRNEFEVGERKTKKPAAQGLSVAGRGQSKNTAQPAIYLHTNSFGPLIIDHSRIGMSMYYPIMDATSKAYDGLILFDAPGGFIEFTQPWKWVKSPWAHNLIGYSNFLFYGKSAFSDTNGDPPNSYNYTAITEGLAYRRKSEPDPDTNLLVRCAPGWYEVARTAYASADYGNLIDPKSPRENGNTNIICVRHADNTKEWMPSDRGLNFGINCD